MRKRTIRAVGVRLGTLDMPPVCAKLSRVVYVCLRLLRIRVANHRPLGFWHSNC